MKRVRILPEGKLLTSPGTADCLLRVKGGKAQTKQMFSGLGRKADTGAFMSTRPSVMGPMMSSLPSERHAAELMLLSVVNAWPPHHAVRGSGEPI
jgi:hypothetical protein